MEQTSTTSLNTGRREADLAALAGGEVVDVLVVGLGVTGAGIALDAAARGLSVAAVDAHDLAFGTSRWSSKLVHGGLRYLARGDVGVAMESARERGVLLEHTAPHLTRALPMLMPIASYVDKNTSRLFRAGIEAGDLLRRAAGTSKVLLPRPRRASAAEALALAPALRSDTLAGAHVYYDGQLEDDVRLVVAIARTAAGFGARIVTYARVTAIGGDGAEVRDARTGNRFTVRARSVINATGVWAGQLVAGVRLRPSRGTHLVLRAATLGDPKGALNLPVPGERGRYVFALPEPNGLVYVGVTDEPVDGPIEDEPQAPESDIAFLLEVLSSALDTPVRRSDVVGAYAGLRPLLDSRDQRSADVSRRHALITAGDGVITVVGGKLTTYRRMAEDAVDAAVARGRFPVGPSLTRRLPLVGAAPRAELDRIRAELERVGGPARLVRRYGTEAPAVAALAQDDPALAEPLAPGVETTRAELVWGLRHEGATCVEDLIDRRCRVGLVPTDRRAALTMAEAVLAEHQ